ncbi:MAG: hypothetical protein PWQ59_2069 [Thermoanaerobacterium sp.]|nr:hypothetical protein [Thermoanaerobacterium sp.]MDI3530130.1 hypothetical protein [Thermoanaerobacter sp.]
MKVAIVRAVISREKLEQGIFTNDSEEIIGYEEIDEMDYYGPLAELIYSKIRGNADKGVVNV